MTICLADLPLILISSCCFKVLYTCSPSSCSFLSTAILPAVSCTPSIPGFVETCTSPAGCMGAASLTGATTVGGGMLASLGGDGASDVFLEERSLLLLLFLSLLLLLLSFLLRPLESRSRLCLGDRERFGLGVLSPGGLLGPICTPCPGMILIGLPSSSLGSPHFRIGRSLQSAVGLTAVVRFGSGRAGLTRGSASFEASTPKFVATASIAWILAVTAAAATADALGMACGTPPAPRFLSPGGVTARPTRRSCPPRSNKFMLLIAS